MLTFLLIMLFIAVFVFLAWRIVNSGLPAKAATPERYVCPVCNENHCECHRRNDAA